MPKMRRGKMIKSLFEILPIYEYEEKNLVSEWVKENQEMGLRGEEIVKRYLEKRYNAKVTKMEDYIGYDLWVEMEGGNFAVEVKTTEEHIDTFFLTITEILKAKRLGEIYNIYRVVKKNDIYKIYILNNPIEMLNIDVGLLENGYENNFVKMYSRDFKVFLKDSLIENVPCIEIANGDLAG